MSSWAGEFPTHRCGLSWSRTVDGCLYGICKTLVHTLLFDGAKIHFFIAHGKGRFSPNLQTSAHCGRPRLLGGGSAAALRVSEWCAACGVKKEIPLTATACRGMVRAAVWGQLRLAVGSLHLRDADASMIPRRPSFLLVLFGGAHHSASERSERAESPPTTNALQRHHWKHLRRSGSRCQPRQGRKLGRAASPRDRHVPVGATAQSPEAVAHAGEIPGRGFIWQ